MLKTYSKTSGFYFGVKSDFLTANDALLEKALKHNERYAEQPPRTHCKLCKARLGTQTDLAQHGVSYSFCDACGHLNGRHEDTDAFVQSLYVAEDGSDYAKAYFDSNFDNRIREIYLPKLRFALDHIERADKVRLLDVGCGAGYLVAAALGQGLTATGIDVNLTLIGYGNDHIESVYGKRPLQHGREESFYATLATTTADLVSAIGVIEHLREPQKLFEAFHLGGAKYLLFSVPMFSPSALFENAFGDVFPRQLSAGHTHLFTEKSIQALYSRANVIPVAEWRFGTDILDLYRCLRVRLAKNAASDKTVHLLDANMLAAIDSLQSVFDRAHFCSEIHCLAAKHPGTTGV